MAEIFERAEWFTEEQLYEISLQVLFLFLFCFIRFLFFIFYFLFFYCFIYLFIFFSERKSQKYKELGIIIGKKKNMFNEKGKKQRNNERK